MSAASDKMRKEWKENDAKRDAGLTMPENVKRFDDLVYGEDTVWNVLDVYRPKEAEGRLPVIVNVHGGGWVYGDKELYQFYAMSLAQRGFAVVNFTYRLAPEHKYPAPLEDTNMVVEWMYQHQDEYGLDMDRVFMVGDSAGGHLAGMYAAICTNPACAENYRFTVPNGFKPVALGLNCGAYVPGTEIVGGADDKELMADFLPGGGTPEELEEISVPRHVTPAFPPTFLMTAVGDFCRKQAPLLRRALEENRVPYFFRTYGDEKNPLYHVFHVTIQEEAGQKCNDDECTFFKCLMKKNL